MTLPVPDLDTRRHADLVAEALRRVPHYAPDWTNHNDSDPGKALINLNAWLVETLLYQINQVPQQNYVAFLNLLGLSPRPARAAETELTFALKPLALPTDPLTVNLPNATRVAVDDPDLPAEVVFETSASARALNGAVGLALVPGPATTWKAVTDFDDKTGATTWQHAFDPFQAGFGSFILAIVLRPTVSKPAEAYAEDRFPKGHLDLYIEKTQVLDPDADGTAITGPLVRAAGLVGQTTELPPVIWEVFTGAEANLLTFGGDAGWQALTVVADGTAALTRSGHVLLDIPGNVTGVRFDALQSDVWASLKLNRPPTTRAALKDALNSQENLLGDALKAALTEKLWGRMGIPPVKFNAVLSACKTGADVAAKLDTLAAEGFDVNPGAIPAAEWAKILPFFKGPPIPQAKTEAGDQTYRRLYFLRATTTDTTVRALNAVHLNTVTAVAASTRADETLGQSNGRPGQGFTLSRFPVWFDPATGRPDLSLEVVEGGLASPWAQVPDFYGQAPDAQVYVLDPGTGQVRFGDGRPRGMGGAIPPPGATIRASRYRFGGGAVGNVGAGAVTQLKGSLDGVAGVSNLRAAQGGDDAESPLQVQGRAPSTLRMQERAMSAQDFADLAQATPGAAIHKAYAISAAAPMQGAFAPRPGAVTVVILPRRDHPTPQPTEAELNIVQAWLDPRRLVTTELFITGPQYFAVQRLSAQLRVTANADLQTVGLAARQAITDWLHPVRGGPDGTGWPFGTDIYHADLYDILLSVPGVRRVAALQVTHQATAETAASDVIPVPEGHLPALVDGALHFEVIYDRT